jgi:hypothetical protein
VNTPPAHRQQELHPLFRERIVHLSLLFGPRDGTQLISCQWNPEPCPAFSCLCLPLVVGML